MENLLVTGTEETPEIDFKTDGLMHITGVSIPENISEFYEIAFNWLNNLSKNPPKEVKLVFDVEYINTSTTRIFIDLIKTVFGFENVGVKSSIVWRYSKDDDDNLELGEYLQFTTKAPIIFEPFSE
ncbi:MAG: DUF1987 domain-containing protein [Bacteroidia bacterium]|nr:DUF1987 domain-containing protein [Bacteroidia bacterium]